MQYLVERLGANRVRILLTFRLPHINICVTRIPVISPEVIKQQGVLFAASREELSDLW